MPRKSHSTAFNLPHFFEPAPVALRLAEPGAQETQRTIPGHLDSSRSAAEAQDVHIVILDALARREIVVAERRAGAFHFVGGDGGTHTAAAEENTPFHNSARNRESEGNCKIGIVVPWIERHVSKFDHFVSFRRQPFLKLLLHFKTAVIGADTDSHTPALLRGFLPFDLSFRGTYDVVHGKPELG